MRINGRIKKRVKGESGWINFEDFEDLEKF